MRSELKKLGQMLKSMNIRSVMVVSIVEVDGAFALSMAKEEDTERRERAGSKTRDRLGILGE